jgi:hypothetical protein
MPGVLDFLVRGWVYWAADRSRRHRSVRCEWLSPATASNPRSQAGIVLLRMLRSRWAGTRS